MTTAMAGVIGPVVRMCGNPECGGMGACDRIRPDAFFGLAEALDPAMGVPDDAACVLLCQELCLSPASDSSGAWRMVPDGCEFTVHKTADWVDGRLRYTAIYSGTARDRDKALAGTPAWDYGAAVERLKRMRAAGMLDAAYRWREEAAGGVHPA